MASLMVTLMVVTLLDPSSFGSDFRGGAWRAGHDLLDGRNPYARPDPALLFSLRHSFVTPPPLAVLAVPFSLLPFNYAVVLWTLANLAAFIAAMRLVGIRRGHVYVLALCSLPLFDSFFAGQSEGFLVLGAAAGWRYRDSPRGGIAVGALIAAKLLAWPLLIWLVATRRWRVAGVAMLGAVLCLAVSWSFFGFKGLADYPDLLAADARAFQAWGLSASIVGEALRFGLSEAAARAIAVASALVAAASVLLLCRRRDEAWYAAALVFGLLSSPLLWLHYLVFLFVAVAVLKPDAVVSWAAVSSLWVLLFPTTAELRTGVVLGVAVAMVMAAAYGRRSSDPRAKSQADVRPTDTIQTGDVSTLSA